jgi:hypothetical protein
METFIKPSLKEAVTCAIMKPRADTPLAANKVIRIESTDLMSKTL